MHTGLYKIHWSLSCNAQDQRLNYTCYCISCTPPPPPPPFSLPLYHPKSQCNKHNFSFENEKFKHLSATLFKKTLPSPGHHLHSSEQQSIIIILQHTQNSVRKISLKCSSQRFQFSAAQMRWFSAHTHTWRGKNLTISNNFGKHASTIHIHQTLCPTTQVLFLFFGMQIQYINFFGP